MRRFLVVAALCAASCGAWANASAVSNMANSNEGAIFNFGLIPYSLQPGQSEDFSFAYSLSVQVDGLPASRTWTACEQIHNTYCGPTPTGFELAEADFLLYIDPRSSFPPGFVIDGLGEISLIASGDTPLTKTQSGIAKVHLENDGYSTASGGFLVLEAAWVDSSGVAPVPEPETYALLLGGLALIGFRRSLKRK